MFALKSHQLGSTKKVGLEKQGVMEEGEDEVIKARFQEIGPRMTVKMRWIRRGPLGETGNARQEREKLEKANGVDPQFGAGSGEVGEGEVGGNGLEDDEDELSEERDAAIAIGLDEKDIDGQPNFDFNAAAAEAEASRRPVEEDGDISMASTSASVEKPAKRPRTVPRKRKLPYHALLRPPPSPSPPPGYQDSEPVPLPSKDGKIKEFSLLSTVGKTWHAGKGEGGVREGKKRREWGWEVSFFFFDFIHLISLSLSFDRSFLF